MALRKRVVESCREKSGLHEMNVRHDQLIYAGYSYMKLMLISCQLTMRTFHIILV